MRALGAQREELGFSAVLGGGAGDGGGGPGWRLRPRSLPDCSGAHQWARPRLLGCGWPGPAGLQEGPTRAPLSVPHMGTLSPHRRYVISSLELLVAEDYMIVYLNGATPRRRMPGIGWLKKCYHMIDRR